ncbi:MAG: hypothetical protein Q9P14_14695 [candidate division KSB1 bacterium]|nr:hypothetical protein [candidate division KSB1 bacterium]
MLGNGEIFGKRPRRNLCSGTRTLAWHPPQFESVQIFNHSYPNLRSRQYSVPYHGSRNRTAIGPFLRIADCNHSAVSANLDFRQVAAALLDIQQLRNIKKY